MATWPWGVRLSLQGRFHSNQCCTWSMHTNADLGIFMDKSGRTRPFLYMANEWDFKMGAQTQEMRLYCCPVWMDGNMLKSWFISLSKALKLPPGRTTVMHLVARETLPEPNSHGEGLYVVARGHAHTPYFLLFSNVYLVLSGAGQRNREKTTESNCCLLL